MSAREAILASVRNALGDGAGRDVVVPRDYRVGRLAGQSDIIDLFVDRVADYRATVRRIDAADLGAELATVLDGRTVMVPDGFPHVVPGGVADAGQSAAELDAIDAVVTTASVGIAMTGTIVLDHGEGQGRRALSLVPDMHVCVIRSEQVVAGVTDAVALLDPSRPQTWISGPSATSDIELNRVEGVHGPRTLVVLLVV